MSIWDQEENERFDFIIKITPKRNGDFGGIKIGTNGRDLVDCKNEAEEMIEQIMRHIDNIDSVEYEVYDNFNEYEDLNDYQVQKMVRDGSYKDLSKYKRKKD